MRISEQAKPVGIEMRQGQAVLLVVIACLVFFAPSLQNGFVNWDDNGFITNNQHIRSLAPASIHAMFTSFVDGNYIPLTQLSFAINYLVGGLDPTGYHAVNVVLHALNAVMVLLLLRGLGLSSVASVGGALLFAVHPLRVESVAWATERKDVLYGFFYLGALLVYLRYLDRRSWLSLALVFALFVLSGLSKQMAISLPVILILLDIMRGRTLDRAAWLEKIPFVLASLALAGAAVLGQHSTSSILSGTQYSLLHRFLLASNSLVLYLKSIVWPVQLSCVYPYPVDVVKECAYAPFLLAAVAGVLIFVGLRFKPAITGPLFFLVSLAPVLNMVPAGSQMIADRFTYLGAVGISYFLAAGAAWLEARLSVRNFRWLAGFAAVLLMILGVLTWERCKVWRSDVALWTDAVAKVPDSYIAQSNLALAHMNRGEFVLAIDGFNKAVRLRPGLADSYGNRGLAYRNRNDTESAIADFTMALTLDPNTGTYWFNRAETYFDREDCDRAIDDYTRAIELEPKGTEALLGRGICYGMKADYERSIADFNRLLEIEPGQLDALFNRGKAFFETGQLDRSLEDFNAILKRDPTYAKAVYHRAVVFIKKGQLGEAWQDLQRVQQLGFTVDADILRQIPEAMRR